MSVGGPHASDRKSSLNEGLHVTDSRFVKSVHTNNCLSVVFELI